MSRFPGFQIARFLLDELSRFPDFQVIQISRFSRSPDFLRLTFQISRFILEIWKVSLKESGNLENLEIWRTWKSGKLVQKIWKSGNLESKSKKDLEILKF